MGSLLAAIEDEAVYQLFREEREMSRDTRRGRTWFWRVYQQDRDFWLDVARSLDHLGTLLSDACTAALIAI